MHSRFTPENIQELQPNEIFVFGSNLRGFHGAGAARTALQFGAEMDNGRGLCGQTYALPTKDGNIRTLPLISIKYYVDEFIEFAMQRPEYTFLVTRIGCGLAGFSDEEIAPLFIPVLKYKWIILPKSFVQILTEPPLIKKLPKDYESFIGEEITAEEINDVLTAIGDSLSEERIPERIDFEYKEGKVEAKLFLKEIA